MLKKIFGFDPSVTTLRTEILAGITTFLTMSYILAVNPSMFSLLEGMPAGAVFTATALASITLHAARAVGLGGRIGSLEPGKDANIAVFAGHPFDFRTRCRLTLIDGRIVHRDGAAE